VRAPYRSYYQALVTSLLRIEHGFACPMDCPGPGTTLRPELRSRPDVAIRRSSVRSDLLLRPARLGGARSRAVASC
jgi:hypothetical protein